MPVYQGCMDTQRIGATQEACNRKPFPLPVPGGGHVPVAAGHRKGRVGPVFSAAIISRVSLPGRCRVLAGAASALPPVRLHQYECQEFPCTSRPATPWHKATGRPAG